MMPVRPFDTFTIGGIAYPMATPEQARAVGAMVRKWKEEHSPPDPLIARARSRAEIDAVLREDARRWPAFATARRAAVMAACERPDPPPVAEVVTALAAFHAYENARGGMRVDISERAPFTDAWRLLRDMGQDISIPVAGTCWRHYERARGLR